MALEFIAWFSSFISEHAIRYGNRGSETTGILPSEFYGEFIPASGKM